MSAVLKKRIPRLLSLALLAIFAVGLFVRLIDLYDAPLDFNPTRQLRSAIIARGLFYKASPQADPLMRALAIEHWERMERLEPPILEALVAQTYRLAGSEHFWIVRFYSSIFWLLGGAVLFRWMKELTSTPAALTGLGLYLFLPFSVFASRSFQPDPLMVALVILSGYALHRWLFRLPEWRWASLAGVAAGLAVLVKPMAVFFTGGMLGGVLIWQWLDQRRKKQKDQWVLPWDKWAFMIVLLILPAGLYYLLGNRSQTTESFLTWTAIARWQDVLSPSFFMRWLIRLDSLTGLSLFFVALLGPWLLEGRNRAVLSGWWLGYFIFGIFFPYHIVTHDYYHLPLIPLVSLSLAALADVVLARIKERGWLARLVYLGVVLIACFYMAWMARSILLGQDHSHAPGFWQYVAEQVPPESKLLGYSQDYGFQLMYYGWRSIDLLPEAISAEQFIQEAAGYDYYLSTDESRASAALQEYLASHYPIHAQGGGFIIYDLQP